VHAVVRASKRDAGTNSVLGKASTIPLPQHQGAQKAKVGSESQ
jgi:hypothetical protein